MFWYFLYTFVISFVLPTITKHFNSDGFFASTLTSHFSCAVFIVSATLCVCSWSVVFISTLKVYFGCVVIVMIIGSCSFSIVIDWHYVPFLVCSFSMLSVALTSRWSVYVISPSCALESTTICLWSISISSRWNNLIMHITKTIKMKMVAMINKVPFLPNFSSKSSQMSHTWLASGHGQHASFKEICHFLNYVSYPVWCWSWA